MSRFPQVLLILTFIPMCWLGMMAAHECGHVMAAICSGGTVTKIVLHPFAISRTDIDPNPHPLLVVWGGPLLGVLLPLGIWGLFRLAQWPLDFLPRFWAGFCLIANGAYIGIGSFDAIGDAREMLLHKTPLWSMWLFGVLTVPCGFAVWHRLGTSFGLGSAAGHVDRRAVISSVLLFVTMTTLLGLLCPTS